MKIKNRVITTEPSPIIAFNIEMLAANPTDMLRATLVLHLADSRHCPGLIEDQSIQPAVFKVLKGIYRV